MNESECYEIVSVGSDEVVMADITEERPCSTATTDPRENSMEGSGPNVKPTPSPIACSNPISGFLILKWRSPLTPSHVSSPLLTLLGSLFSNFDF